MANRTQCVKCEGSAFEVRTIDPAGTKGKVMAVQCANCGTVFSTTDVVPTPLMLAEHADALQALQRRLTSIELLLNAISKVLDGSRRAR